MADSSPEQSHPPPPSTDKSQEQSENLPPEVGRYLPTFEAIFSAGWEWFWKKFNLETEGGHVKEHSLLVKRRASVFLILIACGFFGYFIRGCKKDDEHQTLLAANQTNQATINSLQEEVKHLRLHSDLSLKSIKKNTRVLAEQISDYCRTLETNDPRIDDRDKMIQEFVKASNENVQSNKSAEEIRQRDREIIAQFNAESPKKELAEKRYWQESVEMVLKRFGDRLKTTREKLIEIGFKTPKIDEFLDNPNKQPKLEGCNSAVQELQKIADQINDY